MYSTEQPVAPATDGVCPEQGAGSNSESALPAAFYRLPVNGIDWGYYVAGGDSEAAGNSEPILLVHGFPDTPATFSEQVAPLVAAGYQVIVPYLPGYAGARIESGQHYNPVNLADDFAAFIDALGYQRVIYLGHDWGGLAGYMLAASYPEKVSRLIACSIPHAEGFAAADIRQAWRSRYMLFFQLPFAIALTRRNKLARIKALYREWSPDWQDSDAHVQQVIEQLSDGDTLENAIYYYRLVFRASLFSAKLRRTMQAKIPVPTLAIAGERDGCIDVQCLRAQAGGFSSHYRMASIDAGHFGHRENPEAFNQLLLSYLATEPGSMP